MRYVVLQDKDLKALCAKVEDALRKGWTLQGGVSAYSELETTWYCQAVIKQE